MTGNNSLFSSITKIYGGKVIFRDNSKEKIIRVSNIGGKYSLLIENMFLVNNLKYNLPSIIQLCDKGYKIMFDIACCLLLENDTVLLVGNRKENIYKIKIDARMRIKSYLIASINYSFLWHRKLCHISMDILFKHI